MSAKLQKIETFLSNIYFSNLDKIDFLQNCHPNLMTDIFLFLLNILYCNNFSENLTPMSTKYLFVKGSLCLTSTLTI